jgi:hypothetical protein
VSKSLQYLVFSIGLMTATAAFGARFDTDACQGVACAPSNEQVTSVGRAAILVTNPLAIAALTGNPLFDPISNVYVSPPCTIHVPSLE